MRQKIQVFDHAKEILGAMGKGVILNAKIG